MILIKYFISPIWANPGDTLLSTSRNSYSSKMPLVTIPPLKVTQVLIEYSTRPIRANPVDHRCSSIGYSTHVLAVYLLAPRPHQVCTTLHDFTPLQCQLSQNLFRPTGCAWPVGNSLYK